MRYVALVLVVGLICCAFAAAGLKDSDSRDMRPDVIAVKLDHIIEHYEDTGNAAESIGFLRVESHRLKQLK